MFWLVILGIVALLILSSRSKGGQLAQADKDRLLEQRNKEWRNFVASYDHVAGTVKEKALVARMLHDIDSQYADTPSDSSEVVQGAQESVAQAGVKTPVAVADKKPSAQLDNTSLLLYFGAFLFVAAVGLFIAFGSAGGSLRTFAVFLVLAVMYAGGMWLYDNRPKLRQAAYTFTAIGVVIAPLLGVAAYEYLFAQANGMFVWLVTSLFCLGLYTHAFLKFKQPLLSYLLIFTFLSLFESGVGVVSVPAYYYGWGLAVVAIGLLLLGRCKGYWPEMRESSRMSSQVLLPLSLLVALAMTPAHGSLQLGVSLLFAAVFYGLEVLSAKADEQAIAAVASQAMAITGTAAVSYGVSHDWTVAVASLIVVNLLQVALLQVRRADQRLWRNFGSTLMIASLVTVAGAWPLSWPLLAATAASALVGFVLWIHQRRAEAYALGAIALAALPYIFGQLVLRTAVSAHAQAWLGLAVLPVLLCIHLLVAARARKVKGWLFAAQSSYMVAAIAVAVAAAFAGPFFCLAICTVTALSMVLLAEYDQSADWAEVAALFLLAPLWRSWNDTAVFLQATVVSLGFLIALSLRYRRELLRWMSALVWLLLPFALGRGSVGNMWTPAEYAWGYIVAMFGLIFSRALARGVIFVSGKVPLATFARSASSAYVVGYIFAGALALFLSLFSSNGQLHTTLILAVLLVATIVVSLKVEKRQDILAVVPLLAQAILLSFMRPVAGSAQLQLYLALSTVLAVVSYAASENMRLSRGRLEGVTQASLLSAFVAPASIIFVWQNSWLMPFGLFVAACLLCYHVRQSVQTTREVAGVFVTAAVMWFLATWHVHFLQAYSHSIVVTVAIYAYWRTVRREYRQADNYLWAMVCTATIPLALQAISGESGGLYGYWLLLEEIAIMLLGMAIRKRFVTLWGLYVALGAVLYQLRSLGYAAVAVLALFLIGLAVYRLQRPGTPKE